MGPLLRKIIMRKGFSLVEIIIVVIIIGILVTFAMPQFVKTKERTLDREAQANLKLIQSAERIYRMEKGVFYPPSASTGVIANINSYLRLSLPASGTNWGYAVDSTGSGNATATRSGRVWTILFPAGSSDTPTCSGSGCP